MRARLLAYILLLIGMLSLSLTATASVNSVVVLAPGYDGNYGNFAKSFSQKIRGKIKQLKLVTLEDFDKTTLTPDTLVITLGPQALQHALRRTNATRVIAQLITSEEYFALGDEARPAADKYVKVVFHDAPLLRQILLAHFLVMDARRIGLLLTQQEVNEIPGVKNRLAPVEVELDYRLAGEPENMTRDLLEVINDNDVLIATPNKSIYNRRTIRTILLASYRQEKVVIGYSASFVKAGSLASTYTTVPLLIEELSGFLDRLIDEDPISWQADFTDHFDVVINARVARSLSLPTPDPEQVKSRIKALEEKLEKAPVP